MIKPGTLCLIENCTSHPFANGRTCTVTGAPFIRWACLMYPIDWDDWSSAAWDVLRPISDPDADVSERRDDVVTA